MIPVRVHRVRRYRHDVAVYKKRNTIERMIGRLKQFRRIATRYDKLASRFGSSVALATSIGWLRSDAQFVHRP